MEETKRKFGLSSFTIKLIAIVAMTLDHMAWGGVEFYSVWGQLLHIIGRLAIPIMSFFIVEGYFHTRNLKKYALRLLIFGIISAVPFYMFFGSMYSYRTNIILDLLMALGAVAIADNKNFSKVEKCIAIALLMLISAIIGGWPILPMVYALVFYKFRGNFKKICIWFSFFTILLVAAVALFSYLNGRFGFVNVQWDWYEKLYLAGFLLALPIIGLYNGDKGGTKITSRFFYVYYPAHLLLFAFFYKTYGDVLSIFILLHVAAMALMVVLLVMAAVEKMGSNTSITLMFSFALLFMAGYFGELINPTLESVKAVVKIEYLANVGFMISFTWFVAEFLRLKISSAFYWIEGMIGIATILSVYLMDYTTFFYEGFEMSYDGPFPMAKVDPGPMYFVYYLCVGLLFVIVEAMIIFKSRQASFIEQKRLMVVNHGLVSMVVIILFKVLGITSVDLISFAILSALLFVSYGAMKYGFVSSSKSIAINVINRSNEMVMAIDMSGEVLIMNEKCKILFPDVNEGSFVDKYPKLSKIVNGDENTIVEKERTYEFRKEPMYEEGIVRGYMFWGIDITEHVETITEILIKADTDGLTRLFNRSYIENIVNEGVDRKEPAALFMMDLDNFKQVNDHYGHNTGDAVLIAFAEFLKEIFEQRKCTISRIGGDEFMIYVPGLTDREEVEQVSERIIGRLDSKMSRSGLPTIIGTSIGVAINEGYETAFDKWYKKVDSALYYAKEHGKNDYKIYE